MGLGTFSALTGTSPAIEPSHRISDPERVGAVEVLRFPGGAMAVDPQHNPIESKVLRNVFEKPGQAVKYAAIQS